MTTSKVTYRIDAMDCPTEEQLIRGKLGRMRGVDKLDFDLVSRELTITHSLDDPETLHDALKSIGMAPSTRDASDGDPSGAGPDDAARHWNRRPVVPLRQRIQLGVAGALALGSEIVALATGSEESLIVAIMAIAAIVLGGREMLVKGWHAVRSFTLGINFLMTIAVVGAIVIGEWPEAAMVTVLFAIAEMIEAYALDRSRGAIRDLMKLAPDTAYRRIDLGGWTEVPANAVRVGDVIRVRAGERIPLDGAVSSGSSTVNQAPITGESMPVEKVEGDQVFAGSINERGVIEVTVDHTKSDTTLARIVRAVQQAQSARGETQRFVDRFSRIYTPVVVVAAVLIAVLPPLLTDASFMTWLYRALVLLVIACPCALVISTPVTIVSALAAAARNGMLVKGGVFLEIGHRIRAVALDKTGTLTEGHPRVTDIMPTKAGLTEDEALDLAAALDSGSGHPVARAIVEAHATRRNGVRSPEVADFETITGRGVSGTIDGERYHVGNHRYVHEVDVCTPDVESILLRFESDGKTAASLMNDREVLAVFGIADTSRPSSVEAIKGLHDLGVATIILSGDNQTTVSAVARSAGIDDARGELLPEDKLAAIDDLREQYGTVGMAGDGINDAPALAKSDVGFAMGAAGTDTAIETADVALMEDDLRRIPDFIALSRRTMSVLRQNIALSIGIKVVFFALAVVGAATLWMAVFADMGASLLVTFNGLRLLRN